MRHLGASMKTFRDAHNSFPSCPHALKSLAPCLGAVWVRRCFCTLVPSLRTVSVQCLFRRACGRIEARVPVVM